jgi:glycosyltransferase involved in cell wall biosynthesis
MKILQVIPYFVPAYSYGGPLKVCFDISKELIKRGHEVTVVTTDTLDGKNRIKLLEEEIEGVKIVRFRNLSNYAAKYFNAYLPFGFYRWAKKNLQTYDIVHCHDFFTLQNIIVSYFCRKYKIPFIVQPHGTLSPVRQNARFKLLKKTFLSLFNSVLNYSSSIIALTQHEKSEIIQINNLLNKKTIVIPNGIHSEDFRNIEKINLHHIYKIPIQNRIIGFLGRIQYIKGLDISIEILGGLKNELEFTFLIIGPDEGERKNLEKQIKELGLENRVIFAGILSGKEKLASIKSCDLFLFTSRNEGLPMTILEIAALGIPQIISKECHVPEIEVYNAGFEIDFDKIEMFKTKILQVLNDKNLINQLSINSIKMVSEHFELKNKVSQLEELYKKSTTC